VLLLKDKCTNHNTLEKKEIPPLLAMGGCCCRGDALGENEIEDGRERRGLLHPEEGDMAEEDGGEAVVTINGAAGLSSVLNSNNNNNGSQLQQLRYIRRQGDDPDPNQSSSSDDGEALASRDDVPSSIRRLLAEAYAAQMEAHLKAEDAMIRQVERLTIVERLPSTTFTSKSIANLDPSYKECTICMEEYKDQDEIRFLPCMHFYHQDCIDDWLPRNMTCPICGDSLETQLAGTQ